MGNDCLLYFSGFLLFVSERNAVHLKSSFCLFNCWKAWRSGEKDVEETLDDDDSNNKKISLVQYLFNTGKKILITFLLLIKNIDVIYYLAYGSLAFLGVMIHPFFYSFHLTEIMIRYSTLQNVIKAVWKPKESLLLTLILMIIIVYSLTLLAYLFFHEDYNSTCESVSICFLFTFDFTFKV